MIYSNRVVSNIIDDYIHSERDRELLKRRFVDGIPFEILADEFQLSVTQVKNIVYKNQKIIFKLLDRLETHGVL